MSMTITLPNRIERQLISGWGNELPRRVTEAMAAEGFRSGFLSIGEVAEMLDLSLNDADGFLKERGLFAVENIEEIDVDSAALEELLAK